MHDGVTPTTGEGWFCDDRKKKETQLLTSANGKLSVSAKSVLNLWCEIDLSCLVVRRCSEITKNTLQMSAIECIQSWEQVTERKERNSLTLPEKSLNRVFIPCFFASLQIGLCS